MIYKRHYVQYNDLVFHGDMIAESVVNTSFKSFDQEYTFTHGAYSPKKSEYVLARPKSVSITIRLDMKDIPCEYRDYYKSFVISQLSKYGKLWSVENNTLEWAFAEMRGLNEVQTVRKNKLEFDVDFFLPEGLWHKADKQKTYLVPWNICDFLDCMGYEEIQPCNTGDCCHCTPTNVVQEHCDCCECITKDMALCYQYERGCCKDGLQFFYKCERNVRIVYDCSLADKFFSSYYGNEHPGVKICTQCGYIAGTFYSETEIPTRGVTIHLHGQVTDPVITINGKSNMIKGTFEDLRVYPDMSIYYFDCCEIPLDVSDLIVPLGQNPGWIVYPGMNRITIDGICCQDACVYIEIDAITI